MNQISTMRTGARLGCLVFTVLAVTSAAAQSLNFAPPVSYPAGTPYVVAAGDFNGDGKADLVAGDVTHSDLVVLLGNGDGTLKAPVTYHLASAAYYFSANDFNRDGKLDLATANQYAANISIFFGK